MWSTTTKTGKIKYIERCDPGSGQKYVSVTFDRDTAANRKEAQRILSEKALRKQRKAEKKQTLSEVLEEYCAYQKKHVRPSTQDRNERVLNTCLKYLDGSTPIDELSAGYIKERLPDDDPSKYNTRITRLKAFLRWAYEFDKIESIDFLLKLKPLETNYKEKLQEKYLEKDELKTLLDNMPIESWRLVTEFLCMTGLRIGEFIALNVDDVDLTERTITVNKNYMPVTGRIYPMTKTDTSTRTIRIQNELVPVVERMLEIRPKRGRRFFPSVNGGVMRYDSYRQYLGDMSEKSIGRRITPHALRHTMTSLFAENGADLDLISRRLGHAGSRITKQVYFHVTENLRQADFDATDDIRIL